MMASIRNFPTTVFVAQPEYFRQNYYDAVITGKHFAFDITSGDLSVLRKLPDFLKDKNAKICIFIRPEWLAGYPDVHEIIVRMGIKVIGYATEPIPLSNAQNPHNDLIIRKTNLTEALKIPWDLFIFFDSSSNKTIEQMGFEKVVYSLLPVSHLLFKPENCKLEFDALFIGRYTDYREKYLMPLKVSKKIVHVAHGLHDEWAHFLMNRSAAVINIHNHEYLNFETRVVQSLLCEKISLTEELTQSVLNDHELLRVFHSPEELLMQVNEAGTSNIKITDKSRHKELMYRFHINSFFNLIEQSL